MRDQDWQIGLFGTFDVENYGDLLFPLIAEAELAERLGKVTLHRFSYHAKTPPDWPYLVTSVAELPQMISQLDGVLIGGGFLIRFDKEVAPGYGPPLPTIHHPTGYWLTPALLALQHGVPLIWNAPGACGWYRNDIPTWADPLMELAFTQSRYIAVRDQPSQEALARYIDSTQIAVVPDTAFGLSRLINREPSSEFQRLRHASGLTGPYLLIQAAYGLDFFLHFIKKNAQRLGEFRFLVLPIGPALGEHAAILDTDLPGLVRLTDWPHPLLLAELISQAEAVMGYSYHLAITALVAGVPVFTPVDLSGGRFSAFHGFERIFHVTRDDELDFDWFLGQLGKAAPAPVAQLAHDQLAQHWDDIAAVLKAGHTDTQLAVNRFWQSLPGLLETTATRRAALERAAEAE